MATVKKVKVVARVRCGGCKHFRRDTEGWSCSAITGEYFMGVCALGLKPDSPVKQFADKPRECDKYETSRT